MDASRGRGGARDFATRDDANAAVRRASRASRVGAGSESPRVLVGGVGELYQGDLDLGRVAAARLAAEDLGDGVVVEDLSFGAVGVSHLLARCQPEALVLVGAVQRGRPPGTVERRAVAPLELGARDVHGAIGEAVTGYVSIDLLLQVASGLETLPVRTVTIEVEPARTTPAVELSAAAATALERALALVRSETRQAADRPVDRTAL